MTARTRIWTCAALLLTPWSVRRRVLQRLFGYEIHESARIGFALVVPEQLVMEAKAHIGHGTICKGLGLLYLQESASIGRGNWITATPPGNAKHYRQESARSPTLVVGSHGAITHRHIIDCTGGVSVGSFTTVAGFRSQILTHSIDLSQGVQRSAPVSIGSYAFVGTNAVLLPGSALPDYSVLGAKSLLESAFIDAYCLYAGVPARQVKALPRNSAYFTRKRGYVE